MRPARTIPLPALSPDAGWSAYAENDVISVARTQQPGPEPFQVMQLRGIARTGVNSLRFLSNRFLLSGSDNRLMVWDLSQNTPLMTGVSREAAGRPDLRHQPPAGQQSTGLVRGDHQPVGRLHHRRCADGGRADRDRVQQLPGLAERHRALLRRLRRSDGAAVRRGQPKGRVELATRLAQPVRQQQPRHLVGALRRRAPISCCWPAPVRSPPSTRPPARCSTSDDLSYPTFSADGSRVFGIPDVLAPKGAVDRVAGGELRQLPTGPLELDPRAVQQNGSHAVRL